MCSCPTELAKVRGVLELEPVQVTAFCVCALHSTPTPCCTPLHTHPTPHCTLLQCNARSLLASQGDALEQPWPVCGGLQDDDALTVQVVLQVLTLRVAPTCSFIANEMCSPSLQVNGVKQLSLEVPTTTAEDALALEEFLLQRALNQELLQSPPLRVVIAPNNRLINFVTK